ncbi:intermembrane lipid transfer protein VPS13A-like isoform X5 [Lineus longissimus]|uniref:intermembrane lipid transfer protein VPS13A-like isoform X5 n=1 Tax=Lineus longissimus TaxID=88925 RepID=UPI00315D7A93
MVFESLAAGLINKYLGKYIQNLDTDNLKIGIFSGHVELSHLQLKPEALFELDLPIEVKAGYVGKISLNVPWTSLYTLPVIASVEDVYLLAGPLSDRKYDPEKEKRLLNAIKKQKLEVLESASLINDDEKGEDPGFFEKLGATIINNIQVFVKNIHIRYEDKVTNPDHPFAFGVILRNLSAETTNSQWEVTQIDANTKTIHKVVSMSDFGAYWNPYLPEHSLVRTKLHTDAWRNMLKNAIESHSIMNEDFDFVIRPISAQSKLILNMSEKLSLPKFLGDFVLQEIDIMLSRQQFLNVLSLTESFKLMEVNQQYRKWRPNVSVKNNVKSWWKYAYTAIVESFIRPYSWRRIKEHRNKYHQYRDLYKRKLEKPDSEQITSRLATMEEDLDITNILLAREHAKLEYAREAPERAKRKKNDEGFFSGWFGSSDSEDEYEIQEPKKTNWLSKLTPDEKKKLYEGIGYDENANVVEKPPSYIEHKVLIYLKSCSICLVNYGKEVLRTSITSLSASFENRPHAKGFRVTGKTESFVVEGASIEHELVPIITSDIGVYAPSQITEVFNLDIEMNPVQGDSDVTLKLNVQPVEIVYDEHSVNEVIAFFQVPNLEINDVKAACQHQLEMFAEYSRAGLQYAIDNHKTIDLTVNMRSPYIVIPEFGTLHRGGNVLVIDFGKLKVESELQPKNQNLENATMTEIESRLYDKLNITVTDVKVLLADSGEDWHTAQTQPDSEFHILPSVTLQMSFYSSVKPDYKQLPQQKIVANLPTLKLNVSDNKIVMLTAFAKNIPIPNSQSMPILIEDQVDCPREPGPAGVLEESSNETSDASEDIRECQRTPNLVELRGLKKRVNKCCGKKLRGKDNVDSGNVPPQSTIPQGKKGKKVTKLEKEKFYSASEHSDEDVEDWAKPLQMQSVDDSLSDNNHVKILLRLRVGEVVLQINKQSDRHDVPYLMFRLNRVCTDVAVLDYGLASNVSIGGISVVDKMHTSSSGKYLEMMVSKDSGMALITIMYRKVTPDCPDFKTIYRSVEQGFVVEFSSLQLIVDRVAIIYLTSFIQNLTCSIQNNDMVRSLSTPITTPVVNERAIKSILPKVPIPKEVIQTIDETDLTMPPGSTKVYFVAKISNVGLKLQTKEQGVAELQVDGLETKITMKRNRTTIYARLQNLLVEDSTPETLYPKILSIEDDSLVDLKLVIYNKEGMKPSLRKEAFDFSIRFRVGRVQGVFLNKFVSNITAFVEPLIGALTSEQAAYMKKAQDAVKTQVQTMEVEGKKISMNIDVRAPVIWVPQHSKSPCMLVAELGDLSLKNYHDKTEVKTDRKTLYQQWDHYYLNLDSVQVKSQTMEIVVGSYLSPLSTVQHCHTIIEPISLKLAFKRAIQPLVTPEAQYQISGKLNIIKVNITQKDLKITLCVIKENIGEGQRGKMKDQVDTNNLRPPIPHPGSLNDDLATPTVGDRVMPNTATAKPEPLTRVQLAKASFEMDGMVLALLSEADIPVSPIAPGMTEGLSTFEIGKISMKAAMDTDWACQLHVTLRNLALDDTRPDSRMVVKRIFQYYSVDEKGRIVVNRVQDEAVPPMVDFLYEKSGDGAQKVNLSVEKFRINLCAPFIMALLKFAETVKLSLSAAPDVEDGLMLEKQESDESNQQDNAAMTPDVDNGPLFPMDLSANFKEAEVVVFFEPTVPSSKIWVLKTNAEATFQRQSGGEKLIARVNDLQIISCVFRQRAKTKFMVLQPCNIFFKRCVALDTNVTVMEMQITDISINISTTIVQMTLQIVEYLSSELALRRGRDEVDFVMPHSPQDHLWTIKKISADKWLEKKDDEKCEVIKLKKPVNPSVTMNVGINLVIVTFEIETLDSHMPVLTLKTSLNGHIDDWVLIHSELHLEILYYNEKLAVWEPFVEPVMESENDYRPWEVMVKVIKAQSHNIACLHEDLPMVECDDLDGEIKYNNSKGPKKTESSGTDTDEDTEMTVIRPKLDKVGRMRHGSERSFASTISSQYSTSIHSSIQGESDSEPEGFINTISSKLGSIFSSDSSDNDQSEAEHEVDADDGDGYGVENKAVFITSQGPVHLHQGTEVDVVDGEEEEEQDTCMYVMVDSRDKLLLNVTPQAIQVAKMILETLTKDSSEIHRMVNKPSFEVHNTLGLEVKLKLPPEIKSAVTKLGCNQRQCLPISMHCFVPALDYKGVEVYKNSLVDCSLEYGTDYTEDEDEPDSAGLDVTDGLDEVDGLSFLSKALAKAGHAALSAGAFVYDDDDKTFYNKEDMDRHKAHVLIDGFDPLQNLSHRKAGHYMIPLTPAKHDTDYCVLFDVEAVDGRKVITIRSPLQFHNDLTVPINLYVRSNELTKLGTVLPVAREEYTKITSLEPKEVYNVPLFIAYQCKIFIVPASIGLFGSYQYSGGVSWQDLSVAKDKSRLYTCLPDEQSTNPFNKNPFNFKVVLDTGVAARGPHHLPKLIPNFSLHLHPPVVLHNYLPYDIQFSLEHSPYSSLTHGENTPLYTADLHKAQKLQIQIAEYLGSDWSGNIELGSDMDGFKAISMEPEENNTSHQLSLSIHANHSVAMDLFIYSPYWIINKTGLPVQLRGSGSDVIFENNISSDPLLFRYKKYKKKKMFSCFNCLCLKDPELEIEQSLASTGSMLQAKIRVYNSKWSQSFSLDTVGSTGVIICNDKERKRKYQFLLQIQMSNLKLTKLVTITPYFLVVNTTQSPLRYMEINEQADLWMDIAPNEVLPFFPSTDNMSLTVRYHNSPVSSQAFPIKQPHSTVLRMNNGTALVVEVAGGIETSTTVTFQGYDHGDAPVRIDNLCEDVFIKLHQKNQSQVTLLSPNEQTLYTWDDPTAERTLMWNVYNRKKPSFPAFITKDNFGAEKLNIQTVPGNGSPMSTDDESDGEPEDERKKNGHVAKHMRTDKVVVYWVSYMDGLQRVLMLTQDERVSNKAKKMHDSEKATFSLFLSLDGVGVSLINSLKMEVSFISIYSAPTLWEVEVNHKWKMLNVELASWLEDRFSGEHQQASLQDYIEADLKEMSMTKPFIGALKRTYHPAIWFNFRQSENNTAVHAKVHRIQIDNQLPDAYFTTVLYPTPVPSYILKRTGIKPFIELAMMKRTIPENNVNAFKYFKVLIQEFSIKVDKGFMLSVYDIFANLQKETTESMQLQADLALAHRSLKEAAAVMVSSRPEKIVYEYLHLSPLKMSVSFSLGGKAYQANKPPASFASDIIDFFLNSIGVTLTEIKDVELRMAFFERKGDMLSTPQLLAEIKSHYISQAVKQAYVLVLGLDVLGNPYGLVKDFTQGLGDLFYEPIMGSVQGTDEFAGGIVRGVKSLLGHTVGGAAGSVALITGSLGRGLAALSFDEDYKIRRRKRMNRAKNLPESLAIGGKGFIMGVALGLSGIVVRPIKGIQEEGIEGFFKGIGKGLLDLITKPAGGVLDMVSMAFDGIRRAAEMGDHIVVRMRLPRYIQLDLGLKPYSPYQAVGQRLLQNLCKGEYAKTDHYWAHAPLSKEDGADVALVTTRRILLLEKCKFWGDWDIEMNEKLDNIIGIPAVLDAKLVFKVKKDDSAFSLFTSDEREISSADPDVALWLQRKLGTIMDYMQEQDVPIQQ